MIRHTSKERGSIMAISMIVVLSLLSLGMLSAQSVTTSTKASGMDRSKRIALYAAESGIYAGMEFLAQNRQPSVDYGPFVEPNNTNMVLRPDLPGNDRQPGDPANPFSPDQQAWYQVFILNNPNDPGFATGDDQDARVILRSIGYGPHGARTEISMDVGDVGTLSSVGIPCDSYAQEGMNELGSGSNRCMGSVDSSATTTFSANP